MYQLLHKLARNIAEWRKELFNVLLSLAIIAKSHTQSASKMSWRWQNKIIIILMNCSHF